MSGNLYTSRIDGRRKQCLTKSSKKYGIQKIEIAKKFNYDIDALVAELQRQQQQSGRKVVNLAEESAHAD